jgi:hypothetical protein
MTGEGFSRVVTRLLPNSLNSLNWGATWQQPLSQGVALEWGMVAAMVAEAIVRGWDLSFPALSTTEGNVLFTLRNQIPYHHGAQAGNAGAHFNRTPLKVRFLQSVIPKVVFEKDGKSFSLFREGCPYHMIMTGKTYEDRPDILLLPGRPTPTFPQIVEDGRGIEFSYDLSSELTISGHLRVRNADIIPCTRRTPEGGTEVPIIGIVECSTNKSALVADEQLHRYANTFANITPPPLFLVTGNELPTLSWSRSVVNLDGENLERLQTELCFAASSALDLFGII